MIKINLLPSHILEQGKAKYWIIGAVLVILVVAGSLLLMIRQLNQKVTDEEARLAYWTQEADKVDKVKSSTAGVQGQAGPFQEWNKFFDGVVDNNERYAKQLEEIARWVHAKVVLRALRVNGASVNFDGYADDLDVITEAYMNLMKAKPFIPDSVQLQTEVPAWNGSMYPITTKTGLPERPGTTNFTLTATLQPDLVIANPVPPGAGQAVAGGAPVPGGGGGSGGQFRMRL